MYPEVRVTDNRREWSEKELNRLFPNGDHSHILWLMRVHDTLDFSHKFTPRKLKREYEKKFTPKD